MDPRGTPPTDAPGREPARRAFLELVCRQARTGVFVNLLVLAILVAALWEGLGATTALVWYGVAVLASMLRFAMVAGYYRRPELASTRTWDQLFASTLAINSAVWGVGSIVVLPRLAGDEQLLLMVFLVGLSGGTALLYSAQRLATLAAAFTMLAPAALWFLLQPSLTFRAMGAAAVIQLAMIVRVVRVEGTFVRRYFDLLKELEEARDSAEQLARTDHLTRLRNRRAFYEASEYLLAQARRHERPLTLLLIDLDRFKQINDRHGHAVGDRALRATADALRSASREIDLVGRLGGDEFAILLPDTDGSAAHVVAERIQRQLRDHPVEVGDELLVVQCSIGGAERSSELTADELIARADRALYASKSSGRDRLTLAEDEDVSREEDAG